MKILYLSLAYLSNIIITINKNKKKINICSAHKIISFNLKYEIKINKNINYLLIKSYDESNRLKNIIKKLNILLKNINNFYISKLNFSGKGFKIKKIKEKCFFLFNKSHKVYFVSINSNMRKINKTSVIICQKTNYIHKNEQNIKNIFKQNIFTKKGIRQSSQIIKIKKK